MDDFDCLGNIERENKYQIRDIEYTVMRADDRWADNDNLDEPVKIIYLNRDAAAGRQVDLRVLSWIQITVSSNLFIQR